MTFMALLLAATCFSAYAQQPVIALGGIVNAASYNQPVVPGSIIAIFGTNLADKVYSAAATPLPATLGSTSVSINGIVAPLFFVSPMQINAQAPSSLTSVDGGYTTANVVVTTGFGASAAEPVSVYVESPGVFTTDGSGCGQAAALNVSPDDSLSPNTASNSAAPGDFVTLFGTGFGLAYFPPADGSPAPGAQHLETAGGITISGESLEVQYFGLAPGLVGANQTNFRIPMDTRDGCAVPLTVRGAFSMSPAVTISVHSSRGPCVDPATQSYGTISLIKTISTGTGADGETDTLSASFSAGPRLTRPVVSQTPIAGYIADSIQLSGPSRSCPVAGYVQLSAGTITVSGPNGSATDPQSLPPGFLGAGTYAISATGSSSVGAFQGSATLDPPIQITALNPPETTGEPFTVEWNGGSAGDVVKVSLVFNAFMTQYSSYGYISASAGSYSFQPICTGNPVSAGGNGVFCSFGLPGITEVVVEQMPAADQLATFQASGITGNIQVQWIYRYVIGLN